MSVLIVYDSRTGNVRRFIHKLNMRAIQITEDLIVEEPFVLVTYTTGFGNVPDKVLHFLKNNHPYLAGVSASGNRNWGSNFAKAADIISNMYGVPLISKFELSGTKSDVEFFIKEVNEIEVHRTQQHDYAKG
jgi:protein involved in ribonucleotide reduction